MTSLALAPTAKVTREARVESKREREREKYYTYSSLRLIQVPPGHGCCNGGLDR